MTEEAAPPKPFDLMIATPVYSGASWGFVTSLFQTFFALHEHGIPCRIHGLPGVSDISMARNELTRGFQFSGSGYLLLIDSDITWPVETVLRMVEKAKEGADVICALPPLRHIDHKEIVEAAKKGDERATYRGRRFAMRMLGEREGHGRLELDAKGFGKVDTAGAAFMLISQKAVRQIADAHPELMYRAPDATKGTAIWDPIVRDGDRYSEDMSFCRRWRDLGGDIWVLADAAMTHEGAFPVQGNFADTIGT